MIWILLLFAAITIISGIWSRPKDDGDFHIVNRTVTTLGLVAATFTLIGGGEFLTLTALTYSYGWWAILFFVGAAIGFLITAYLAPKIREGSVEHDHHSLTDFFYTKYGRLVSIPTTVITVIGLGALLLIQFVVGGQMISLLTGISSAWAILGICALVFAYLFVSGFRGVLATDISQGIFMLVALFILAFTINSGDGVSAAALQRSSIPLADAAALFVFSITAVLGSSDIWQRLLATKDTRSVRRGLVTNATLFILFAVLFVLLVGAIQTALPDANPNTAFTDFIATALTDWQRVFMAFLILATVISTADIEMFVLSILLHKEFFRARQHLDLQRTRMFLVGIAVASGALALFFQNLVEIYFFLLYIMIGLGVITLGTLLQRGNQITAFIGLVGSVLAVVLMAISGYMVGWYQFLPLVPAIPHLLVRARQATRVEPAGSRAVA